MSLDRVDAYLDSHANEFVDCLQQFLTIPSVSAVSEHAGDVREAAEFVHRQFSELGLNTETVATDGNPIVYAEWLEAPGAPTALVYGHYDVQPPDPLDEWVTPPFEPTVRDGCIYARGATDDKGQMLTHVKSVEAWMKTEGKLPVNVKFVIEGEEEVGSDNLERFLESRKAQLQADVGVISDTSQYGPGMPAITYGLRGILACEFAVTGPRQDLHSGVFGGSVMNPANGLARLIAALCDERGHVHVPGFYDDVVPLSNAERKRLAALPFDAEQYRTSLGVSALWGEEGYTTTERRWARPTCDVNGMISGYTGEGPKTIVPARASAKLSCRLVPNQDPQRLADAVYQFLHDNLPAGLALEFKQYHSCPALAFDTTSPHMAAAETAIHDAFGVEPVLIREGGSIPVVGTFRDVLGIDTLLLGWGQNTDNLHSPNEHFSLADYQRGIRASAHLWHYLAERQA